MTRTRLSLVAFLGAAAIATAQSTDGADRETQAATLAVEPTTIVDLLEAEAADEEERALTALLDDESLRGAGALRGQRRDRRRGSGHCCVKRRRVERRRLRRQGEGRLRRRP